MKRYGLRFKGLPVKFLTECKDGEWVKYNEAMDNRTDLIVSMNEIRESQIKNLTNYYNKETEANKIITNKKYILCLYGMAAIIIILSLELFV